MEGKRYAAGLVSGLLLGLVVVAASSGILLGSVTAGFGPSLAPSANYATTTSVASMTTFAVATTFLTTSTITNIQRDLTTNATYAVTVTSTTMAFTMSQSTTTVYPVPTTSSYGLTKTNNYTFGSAAANAANAAPSSHLYGLIHQSLFSDAIILVPVLLAFFIGAIIYRFAIASQGEEEA